MRNAVTVIGLAIAAHLVHGAVSAQEDGTLQGTASIEGTVLGTARPLARAEVKLRSRSAQTWWATTDENGRYVFPRVPAGEYTAVASKPGYLETAYGASVPQSFEADAMTRLVTGVTLRLTAGQSRKEVSWALPRMGSISGFATDEHGEPLFNVAVRALRVSAAASATLTTAGITTTDDLGAYRIGRLPPGEYVVSFRTGEQFTEAQLHQRVVVQAMLQQVSAVRAGTVSLDDVARSADPQPYGESARDRGSIYYPGTDARGEAVPIRLGVSHDAIGVDVQIRTKAK